jgi:hypothetical protein
MRFVPLLFLVVPLANASVSQWDMTALTMGEVNKRIELYALKRGTPASLKEVYGDLEIPRDAWGRPLMYEVPGPAGEPFELVSYGEDGVPGSTRGCTGRYGDDIRWSEVK